MSRSDVKFGMAAPQVFWDGVVDVASLRRCAEIADQSELDSLWWQSQLIGSTNVMEPISSLAFVAALTRRIKLGTSTFVVREHNPIQLAKQLACIDQLSQGRLVVGLGMGVERLTASVGGIATDRPVGRLLETVAIMKKLWSEDDVTFRGRLWQFDSMSLNPKPAQRPWPPIWLGGRHPNALRRAVLHGDGWMGPGASSTEQFRDDVSVLRSILDKTGRAPEDFTIAKRVFVHVDSDTKRAEEQVRRRFASYGGNPDRGSDVSLFGKADAVAQGIRSVIDAGATLVVLNPVADFVEQQERILDLLGSHLTRGSGVALE